MTEENTNRLNSDWADYDAAGSLTHFKFPGNSAWDWTASYDAENRQRYFCADTSTACGSAISTAAEYHYDGDGRRVKRVLGGQTTVFVYDAFGMLAAEYSTTAPEETGGRRYRTTDHLGSTRLVTNSIGAVVSRHDYVPFGEELQANSSAGNRNLVFGFGVNPSERHKFTGKERDVESGLDYFGARYFGASLGRFTSADEPFADQEVANPQSWNLYSYVRSNPLRAIDPTGRCSQAADGGYTDEGNGLFEGPCASGVIGDTDTKNPNSITVGVGRDVANLIMLQGVGENLSSSQQWASMITGAGRDTMGVIAPFATELAECLGGNCSGFNLAVAAVPGGTVVTKLTRWGWTGGLKWRRALAALKKPGDHTAIEKIVPTVEEAAELIKAGKGKILRIESGHALGGPSTHTYDHINYLTEAGQKATVKVQR